ncbi:hypothetical protein BKA67DRAFT_556817 [Truncatella angustata]|uniref:Uncharacterized protein n=1 Tax=Truncatella angustata TaxID=152316 RepID=A0A9P9A051_9PEZI|nr:uncharacterized protein BKA67DRAFT_556817 [Truncatella angustata]KAH6657962.1 hypothetical protein BKA67DRAFT_556817 [Truncatella angustata]
MPNELREQLYAGEQQHLERKRKRGDSLAGRIPPIQITNVLPGGSGMSTTTPRVLLKYLGSET